MEIDPKFKSFQVPPDPGKIEPGPEKIQKEAPRFTVEKAPPSPEMDVPTIPIDPLKSKLTELIQNKNLDDPQEKLEVGLLVMRETLLSVFGESFLSGLDMETMMETFRDFVQNDPALGEMFNNLLHSLSTPSQKV